MAKKPGNGAQEEPVTDKEKELSTGNDDTLQLAEGEGKEGEETPSQEEAVAALQKQLDDIKAQRAKDNERQTQITKERDDAVRLAQERETKLAQVQQETAQSRYDAVASAIAAATAEAQAAKTAALVAHGNGDMEAQLEAIGRLSRAESNLANLESGKSALEEEVKRQQELTKQLAERKPAPPDPIERSGLPERAKAWLREHPEYISDTRKNARLNYLHHEAVEGQGLTAYSDPYFDWIEGQLTPRQEERREQQRGAVVSAPVSREVPTGGSQRPGDVRLTAAQREAAKIAGVSEKDYALHLAKLTELKANGQYVAGGN